MQRISVNTANKRKADWAVREDETKVTVEYAVSKLTEGTVGDALTWYKCGY